MHQAKNGKDVDLAGFLETGLEIKSHLASFLKITREELEARLPQGSLDLAAVHPGSLKPEETTSFYEEKVGNAHLLELAAWHLGSADYIAETLRLQEMFAKGNLLDFGGGIGTHALCAASLSTVNHVWFVDLNPQNREFVRQRSACLGLDHKISFFRDLNDIKNVKFDTLVCLDVLEHLPDPSLQLMQFLDYLSSDAIALLNWYFYKGARGEYPFHFDDPGLIEKFFQTLQGNFIEVFHPLLITTRAYKPYRPA